MGPVEERALRDIALYLKYISQDIRAIRKRLCEDGNVPVEENTEKSLT